jgi:YXWGXW repeat-containing protein
MRILRSLALAFVLGAGFPSVLLSTADAQAVIDIRVDFPPPPLPIYEQPPIPGPGYIWTPGYWAWEGSDYYWVPGTWVLAPRPSVLWTPGYWGWSEGVYVFHDGYWAPRIGFYGGVAYGFGYTGVGYEGGYWDNGNFFYNRAVNNITNVNVTTVYEKTVVVNQTINNVSYNGGAGGIVAQARPDELVAEKEPHVGRSRCLRSGLLTAVSVNRDEGRP